MYDIKQGVPRPANLKSRQGGETKYPLRQMRVDDYFEVPKEDFATPFVVSEYDPVKFRNRVNQSTRNAAMSLTKELRERGEMNQSEKVKFTVAVLDNGNIGVWRDS